MTAALVLVATPIGNLGDLSPRAVTTLSESSLILCEDTRHSGKLLSHAGVGGVRLRLPHRRRIPTVEFIVFNQELATLLRAGLPLVQSLDILRKRVPNPVFRQALDDIYEKVKSGISLSEAFEEQKLFSGVYTASLMAGEKSGSLETVIRRYVQHVKVLNAVRQHVISALIYPAVLVGLSAVVVGSILTWVVYRATALLSPERQARALLGTSQQMLDLIPEVDPERDHIRGPAQASVTVVEYASVHPGHFVCRLQRGQRPPQFLIDQRRGIAAIADHCAA